MIRAERLNHLIRVLSTITEPERFDMGVWYYEISSTFDPLNKECGFAGCALGWASTDPIFQELGLKLDKSTGLIVYIDPAINNTNSIPFSFLAAQLFFDISEEECYFIFDEDYYYENFCPIDTWEKVYAKSKDFDKTFYTNLFFLENWEDNYHKRVTAERVIQHVKFVRDNCEVLAYND